MATVVLGEPRALGAAAKYADYKPWLLHHFFDHICSYCLLQDAGVHVEHYLPTKFRPDLEHEPTNLLLGCDRCNGGGGKSDYHPDHKRRVRRPHDTSGYLIIDVRADDLASMFEVAADGSIDARPGASRGRAVWNIEILKLDFPSPRARRKELRDLRDSCEEALLGLAEAATDVDRERFSHLLDLLLPALARRLVFFEVLGLPVSAALVDRVRPLREALRGAHPGTSES